MTGEHYLIVFGYYKLDIYYEDIVNVYTVTARDVLDVLGYDVKTTTHTFSYDLCYPRIKERASDISKDLTDFPPSVI